jgi:hypothetical protein
MFCHNFPEVVEKVQFWCNMYQERLSGRTKSGGFTYVQTCNICTTYQAYEDCAEE